MISDPPPDVTVLIPAHNEENVIVQTVSSVLATNTKNLQIIVVNDGSTDRTGALLDEHFGADPRVHIIHQVNRGKSAALSLAMSQAQTKIVVTIDADTEIEPDAISKLLRHFSDPRVGAVAGNVKVGNRTRWLTRWQALEYITSQNMEKRAFDLLNCITVVPGALGAWRTEAIEAAGGITSDTVAEDADLTIAIRRLGWRISYDEEAIAWTEAPETPGALIRQRFRWTFGTLQSFWKHRDTLLRPKYGTLGLDRAAQYFCVSTGASAHFTDYRFDVSRLDRAMGRRPAAYRATCRNFGPPPTCSDLYFSSLDFCSSMFSPAWWPLRWNARKIGPCSFLCSYSASTIAS